MVTVTAWGVVPIYKAKKSYIELFGPFKSMPFTYLEFPRKSITPPPHPKNSKKNIHLTKSSRNSSWAWRWYGILKTLGGEAASNFVLLQKTTCLCWVLGCFDPKTHCLVHMDTKFTAHHNPPKNASMSCGIMSLFFWHLVVWDSRDDPK